MHKVKLGLLPLQIICQIILAVEAVDYIVHMKRDWKQPPYF